MISKQLIYENIYCGMKMENRNVTFPQTKTILEGVNVPGVQLDDIQAILNMRDAWRYLISSVDSPVTLDYMCKLNEYIARNEALEWGKLRTGRVGISGTDYIPPIPSYDSVSAELDEILSRHISETEKALEVFMWGAKGQFFWDSNKRTSLTLTNKILIQAGKGMLTIRQEHMENFNTLLFEFYDKDKKENLKEFLYRNAICGIDF